MKKLYGVVTGLALGVGVCVGAVSAEERFGTLTGIPAEVMSAESMEAIQGKGIYDYMPYGFGSALSYGFVHSSAAYSGANLIGKYLPSLMPILSGNFGYRYSNTQATQALRALDQRYGNLFAAGSRLSGIPLSGYR